MELKWKEAIEKVLEEEKKALHYSEIAELIAERGYRTSLGATPKDTVSSYLTSDLNTNKEKSKFVKVDKGIYILRKFFDNGSLPLGNESKQKEKIEKFRIINSFGIYWDSNLVDWKSISDLFGVQQIGANNVNFKDQIGVYLLHDNRETIYVGQAIGGQQPLGKRLSDHTKDRLKGRWNRFSWFGLYPVNDSGKLHNNIKFDNISVQALGDVLEAILIESIEPRQNRRQGDDFFGIEYIQQESPEIKKKRNQQLLKELSEKLEDQ